MCKGMLCEGSSAVDKDGTADKNSKVQLEFVKKGDERESKDWKLNNNTQSATLPLFFAPPLLGDSCSTLLFPGGFDGFFPSEEAMTPWL